MTDGLESAYYRAPYPPRPLGEGPGVRAWVRDADRILVVDESRGRSWSLHGVEAAIWDLLVLGYSLEGMLDSLSALLETSWQDAQGVLFELLMKWEQEGILPSPSGRGAGGEGTVGG